MIIAGNASNLLVAAAAANKRVARVPQPRPTTVALLAYRSYIPGMPTWDEPKRGENIRRNGLDFLGCEIIFDTPISILEDTRAEYGEQRLNAIGWLRGLVVHMTYTERDDDFHVISLREAKRHEIKRYIKEISR